MFDTPIIAQKPFVVNRFLTIDENSFFCYTESMEKRKMETITEASERVGVTPAALRQAIDRKTLSARRVGPVYWVAVQDVDAYIARTGGRVGRPKKQAGQEGGE